MSLSLYCRECGWMASDSIQLEEHWKFIHHGFRQPPPNITQKDFDNISNWGLHKQAHTCPVCLDHYTQMVGLAHHISSSHPVRDYFRPMTHTSQILLDHWVQIVHACFGKKIAENIIKGIKHRKCPECRNFFKSTEDCATHMFKEHFKNRQQAINSETYINWSRYVNLVNPGVLPAVEEQHLEADKKSPRFVLRRQPDIEVLMDSPVMAQQQMAQDLQEELFAQI